MSGSDGERRCCPLHLNLGTGIVRPVDAEIQWGYIIGDDGIGIVGAEDCPTLLWKRALGTAEAQQPNDEQNEAYRSPHCLICAK